VAAGVLVAAGTVMLLMLFSNIGASSAEASRISPTTDTMLSSLSGSPNIVADMFATVSSRLDGTLTSFERGLQVIGGSFNQSGSQMAHTMTAGTAGALQSVGRGLGSMAVASANGIVFVLRIPEHTLGYLGNTRLVGAVIRPSDNDHEHENVPIIDPNSPELFKALSVMAPAATSSTATPLSIWPIHGQITTEFGASDWPYQTVHTGIDISDGWRIGVTPVHPFRMGRVLQTIHSSVGLGNHVVVDHGNGVTSVYGHLDSISVTVGQQVDTTTVLGYEGTTGASTGPHVHFEIRVNGQAANPHQFIAGQP